MYIMLSCSQTIFQTFMNVNKPVRYQTNNDRLVHHVTVGGIYCSTLQSD